MIVVSLSPNAHAPSPPPLPTPTPPPSNHYSFEVAIFEDKTTVASWFKDLCSFLFQVMLLRSRQLEALALFR